MTQKINKPKLWNKKPLKGEWLATLKLDGVRVLKGDDGYISRANKPLYNLDHLTITDAEVFAGNWEGSITAVRTQQGTPVPEEWVYSLEPLDSRLIIKELIDPSAEEIHELLNKVVSEGNEGLVLRQGDKWIKVKQEETFDVKVTGKQVGTGKYTGMLGALLTEKGKVGTGFTDEQRKVNDIDVGDTIEVRSMSLTPSGKFRHPRFIRHRTDK